MSKSRELAEAYMQVWSVGNLSLLDSLAAPNLWVDYSHFPAPVEGIEQFKAILRQTHASFPDLVLHVEEVFGLDHKVTVRWRYHGTHRHGKVFDIAPTGKHVHVTGISILEIANHKVHAERGIVDNFSLLHQLQSGE